MKRVFLMHFATPILIEVAKNLKARGVDIVYWEGYRDAFDELSRTKAGFGDTIFSHAWDAIKNIPPKEIDVSEFEPLSREIIEKMYPYGWHALSMISRTSYGESAFVQQRNKYYSYVSFWNGMLDEYKPDAIIFSSVPHLASGFALYGLARLKNVQTIILERIISVGSRALILDDYSDFSALRESYKRVGGTAGAPEELSEDLKAYYRSQRKLLVSESAAEERSHLRTHGNKMPFRMPTLGAIFRNILRLTFFKTTYSYLCMLFSKRKTYYHERDFTGLELTLLTRRLGRKSKALQKEYAALQMAPDYGKKYVYIPLAFQPEHTTLPMGGAFDDQLLMVDIIASALPHGWVAYVKEHLPQWYPFHTQAHWYRYPGYYEHIARKKNVYLVGADTHPRTLIQNARAVATATGTAGWEALLAGKPALVFGNVWYEYCNGVSKVSSTAECRKAMEKIQGGYAPSEQDVIRYLRALDAVSIKVHNYKTRTFAKSGGISREENISTLTNALVRALA